MPSRLNTVPTVPDAVGYPPAPRGLSKCQRTLWRDICRSKPVAWWDAAALALLAALVRHAETAELLQAQFDQLGDLRSPETLARLQQLSVLRDRETKALASLSTKLRLTAQARYEPRRAYRDGAVQAVDAANPFLRHRRTAA